MRIINNKYLKAILKANKIILLAIGVILLAWTINIEISYSEAQRTEWEITFNKLIRELSCIAITTALVALFWDKFKDEAMEEKVKAWINGSWQKPDRSITIFNKTKKEHVYLGYPNREFIDVIPRAELDKDEDYCFKNVTEKMALQTNKDKDKFPVLIVGTTLGFLDLGTAKDTEEDKQKKEKNRMALGEAIQKGVHFKFVLVDPDRRFTSSKQKNNVKEKNNINSRNALMGIKQIIESLKNKHVRGSIDVRLIPCNIDEHSFSSFICDGRRISVLDFNFDNGNKISQIFDERYDENLPENDLADNLTRKYKIAHQDAFFSIKFPLYDELTIYILGIRNNRIFVISEENGLWNVPILSTKKYYDIQYDVQKKFEEVNNYFNIRFERMVTCDNSQGKKIFFFIGVNNRKNKDTANTKEYIDAEKDYEFAHYKCLYKG